MGPVLSRIVNFLGLMFRKHKLVTLHPPEDQIFLCPACGGNIEAITFCYKHQDGARIYPCEDVITIEQARGLIA